MKSIDYYATVNQGKIPTNVSMAIRNSLQQLPDGFKLKITLAEKTNKRSLCQNSFYWGAVIPAIQEEVKQHGIEWSAEQTHVYLASEVGKLKTTMIHKDKVIPYIRSTTTLSTKEFEDYMTAIRVWAAQWGVIIPLPNEINS